MYNERDAYSFGILGNQPPSSVQAMSTNPNLYSLPISGQSGPGGLLGSTGTQSYHPHSSSFSVPSYSQISMQQAYSTQLAPDHMPSCQAPTSFQTQQQQPLQQYSPVVNTNSDKQLILQNARSTGPSSGGYGRSSSLPNGPVNIQLGMSIASPSYSTGGGGAISGPISNSIVSLAQQHVPTSNTILSVNDNRTVSQSQLPCRSTGSRVTPDLSGFSGQSIYASYSSGVAAAQPAAASAGPSGVANLQVPYSIAIFSSPIPVTMSSVMNKSNISSVASYCSSAAVTQQGTPGSGPTGRPSCCSTLTLGMQQPSIYVSQQPRLPSQSSNFASTGYVGQQYPPSSVQFRPGTNVPGSVPSVPMMSRPHNTSPLLSKDISGSNCMVMHPGLIQQPTQSSQLPICSSTVSSGSPNSCSVYPSSTSCKGFRSSVSGSAGQMFSVSGCGVPPNVIGSNTSVTPPASIILNGPTQPMVQPTLIGHVNGCVPIGSEHDMKMLRGEFDGIPANSSSMMMMTMPVSSPIPGGTLISNSLPTGVINVAMVNQTPAPPPYHQSNSLVNCRSMGPTPFYGPPEMSSVAVTCGMHNSASSSMSSLPDTCAMMSAGSMNTEHHFLGIPGESITISEASLKQSQSGSLKTAARPKRTRAIKNTPGAGRVSKANAKKNAAANAAAAASATPPSIALQSGTATSDPYTMSNIRPSAQQSQANSVRQKTPGPGWNACPSNVMGSFPSSLASPPLSMSLCDGRTGSVSPASFASSNGILMRPNSGPPLNMAFSTAPHGNGQLISTGPVDNVGRLLSSPRLYSSIPNQQQQYLNPSMTTSGHMQNGSLFVGHAHQSSQSSCLPSVTAVAPISQSQQQHHPGHSICGNGSNMRFVQSPMHVQAQQSVSTQSALLAPNRIPLHAPPRTTTPVGPGSGPFHFDPNYAAGPPLGSTAGTAPSEMPIVCSTVDTDRLVCPITNGMVWGPAQIQLNDVLHKFLPDGMFVLRFEFDLTANHLNTIVGRSDLDIVVCSHLISEPLQVCHWPSDAVQIRFNEYLLRLDRSTVSGGQSAHKVACVKQLCRPGRNQLEIAILGLGEDPNHLPTMNKRHSMAAILETHRFAAFMAHMPALNVLLDGLKRRRPAGVNVLCNILEGRVGPRADSDSQILQPRNTPVVAELNLVCPVFRTRMNVPGRITGCEHVEAFDMEAFLRREVLWPRLNCPICGHKSPAGLDGLCIDTTIMNVLRLVHPAIENILVRSDGFWRLPPPVCLDLPLDVDQWQPLIGPLTEIVTNALGSVAVVRSCEQRLSLSSPSSNQLASDWVTKRAFTEHHQTVTSSGDHLKTICIAPGITGKEDSSPWTTDAPTSPSVPCKGTCSLSDFSWSHNMLGSKAPMGSRPASQPTDWPAAQVSPLESAVASPSQSTKPPGVRKSAHCLPSDPQVSRQMPSSKDGLHTSQSNHESSVPQTDPADAIGSVGQADSFSNHSIPCFSDRSAIATRRSFTGWSDPISCVTSADSLSCFGNAVLCCSSSSLPSSPAFSPRSASTSLVIPPTSEITANAVERTSSSMHCGLSPVVVHPDGAVGSEYSAVAATKDVSSFVVHSPQSSFSSVTASKTSSVGFRFSSEEKTGIVLWNGSGSCCQQIPTSDAVIDTIGTSAAQSSEYGYNKRHTSSLNMGLDFLLAEEQSMTDHMSVRNFHEHSSSLQTIAVRTSSGGQLPSVESVTLTNGTSHTLDSRSVKRALGNSLYDHDPVSSQSITIGYGDCCGSAVQVDHDLDTRVVESNFSASPSITDTKRIKVDPDCPPPVSSNEAKCDDNCVSSNSASDEDFGHSKLKVEPNSWSDENYNFWTSCSPHSHSPSCCSGFKESDSRQDSAFHSNPCAHNPLSLFSNPLDEHLCVDSIHSLSAQIDRIEIFLDESYIRFVQGFACT